MGQESKSNLAQSLSWGPSQDVSQSCDLLRTWLWLKDLLPKQLLHMPGKLVLVVSRRPHFLSMWTSPCDCWSDPSDISKTETTMPFITEPLKSYSIKFLQFPIQRGKGMNTRNKRIRGERRLCCVGLVLGQVTSRKGPFREVWRKHRGHEVDSFRSFCHSSPFLGLKSCMVICKTFHQ